MLLCSIIVSPPVVFSDRRKPDGGGTDIAAANRTVAGCSNIGSCYTQRIALSLRGLPLAVRVAFVWK
jgi:hypothetical protein